MAIQASVDVRNARLAAVETAVGTAPKLQLRSGAQPANCAAAAAGTLLCEITLPSDWLAAPASGSVAKAGTWSGTGAASGVVGHYRILNGGGTVCHLQGSVTLGGGGGDATMDNTNVATGQTVTVSAFTLTEANA
jgi:hypothetical protein